MAKKSKKAIKFPWKSIALIAIFVIAAGFLLYSTSGGSEDENTAGESGIVLSVVNDPACSICDSSGLVNQLKSIFTSMEVIELDYKSGKGKDLVKEFGIQGIPAYVFSSAIEEDEEFPNMERYLIKGKGLYLLRTEFVKFINREETEKTVSLFVMSQCPYGTMAETALEEVLDAIPELEWDIHFIASYDSNTDTFLSLHGQPEVDEDLRQVCVMEHYSDEFLDYLACVNQDYGNAESVWENCASDTGIAVSRIKTCFEGDEGKELLKDNVALSNELQIGSSPTFLLNNQIVFNAISAENVKQNVCIENSGMSGCEQTLSSTGSEGGMC